MDRCQLIAQDLKALNKKSLVYSQELQQTFDRFYFWALPRIKPRSDIEIASPVKRSAFARIDDRLKLCLDSINDYVHPNYGSHVAYLRPLSQPIDTIKSCLHAVYSIFFEINWLHRRLRREFRPWRTSVMNLLSKSPPKCCAIYFLTLTK